MSGAVYLFSSVSVLHEWELNVTAKTYSKQKQKIVRNINNIAKYQLSIQQLYQNIKSDLTVFEVLWFKRF